MSQLICGGCHTLLMYTRGATSVRCSCCHTVSLVPGKSLNSFRSLQRFFIHFTVYHLNEMTRTSGSVLSLQRLLMYLIVYPSRIMT